MVQCGTCNRFHRPDEPRCPFCHGPGVARKMMGIVGGTVTTLVLAACYGAPGGGPPPDTAGPPATGETGDTDRPQDGDGDGFRADRDCDDTNAAINPDADEICDDGVDNDCDGLIDSADPECPTP